MCVRNLGRQNRLELERRRWPSLQFDFDHHENSAHNAVRCANECVALYLAQDWRSSREAWLTTNGLLAQ